jgi:MinD superfamily P-loop ATPase
LVSLLKIFKIRSGVIINKYDINKDVSISIEEFIESNGISLLAKIPFDKNFIKAIQSSRSIIHYDCSYRDKFNTIWSDIEKILLN